MNSKFVIAMVFLVTIGCFLNLSSAVNTTDTMDNKFYYDLMNITWNQYDEDMLCSSEILNDYVNENITNRDAMVLTTTLFVLTSYNLDLISEITPPPECYDYHEYVLSALLYLEEYLYDMVKYYETDKKSYIVYAKENYDISSQYYDKAAEEFKMLGFF